MGTTVEMGTGTILQVVFSSLHNWVVHSGRPRMDLHTVVLGLEFASKIRSALAASKNYIAHYSSAHRAQPELESSADVKPRRSVVKGPQVIHELDGSLEFGFFLAGRAATAIGIPQAGLV